MATPLTQSGSATTASAATSLMGIYGTVKDKWETSGASKAVSDIYSNVPQGTKDYFAATSTQLFSREQLRTVSVFFGIGEERPFYLEKNPSLLVARLRHNLTFFYLNYMLMTAAIFLFTVVFSPTKILGIGLLGMAWMWVVRSTQNGSLRVGNIAIPQKQVLVGMAIFSAFIMVYLLSGIFWWSLFSSGFLTLVHALTRDASMHKDADDKVDMIGDLTFDGGEDAAFLNNVESVKIDQL